MSKALTFSNVATTSRKSVVHCVAWLDFVVDSCVYVSLRLYRRCSRFAYVCFRYVEVWRGCKRSNDTIFDDVGSNSINVFDVFAENENA